MINLTEINNTLKRFKEIYSLFGDISEVREIYNYPYIKQGLNKEEYNFYGILNSSNEDWKIQFLSKIDFMIKEVNLIFSREQIKNGLMNNPFSFNSELEFALFCKIKGIKIIESEPQIAYGNKLDLMIEIKGQRVLIEVITPRIKKEMIERNCGFFPISGEIEFNIFQEFNSHNLNQTPVPFALAINPIYAGIDEIQVSCAIEEFRNNHKKLSRFLLGVILMRPKKYNLLTSEEVGGYQFFRNQDSKFNLNIL
jgi:hypothetical protein